MQTADYIISAFGTGEQSLITLQLRTNEINLST